MMLKINKILGVVVICLLFLPGVVCSHEGRPIYIEIEETFGRLLSMRWKIPPVLSPGSEPTITLEGEGCSLLAGNKIPALTGTGTYECDGISSDIKVRIDYPYQNPALSTLIYFKSSNGASWSLFRGPDVEVIPLPGRLSALDLAGEYIAAGIRHILSGYDHLLFLICLMQLTGGLRSILTTVSGFTLGHSITLALASLDVWQIRTELVEVLIALSIVMLAAEIIKGGRNTLIRRYPVSVAAVFGLLHGFGFAGALGEMGLPQEMEIQALAYFNIGVELGQALFVVAALAVIRIIYFKKSWLKYDIEKKQKLPGYVVYGVGVVGSYWVIDRAIGFII